MSNWDFYYLPASQAPVPMDDGDYTHRKFTDTYFYDDFEEFLVRDGDALFYYYCYHPSSSKTTFFLYPSENMSDMFSDIITFIDRWNFPSVQKQWPNFATAYQNGESEQSNKILLKKIPNWQDYGKKDVVFMVTVDKWIDFEPTYLYREIIYRLVDFANEAINEVLNDNGCLNFEGQVKSFLRGAKEGSLLSKIFGF